MKDLQQTGKEGEKIAQLIELVEGLNPFYIMSEGPKMAEKQPLLGGVLSVYRSDLDLLESGEVLKLIFLIWEYFKDFEQILKVEVTGEQLDRAMQRTIDLLESLESEKGQKARHEFIESDLRHLRSKELWYGILSQFKHKEALAEMDAGKKWSILAGLKSLIECFDEII